MVKLNKTTTIKYYKNYNYVKIINNHIERRSTSDIIFLEA